MLGKRVAGSAVLRVCWGSSDGWVEWVCRGSLGSSGCYWSTEAAWAEATRFANASAGTAKLGQCLGQGRQCQRSVGAPAAAESIGAPTVGAANEAGVWNEAAAGTADASRRVVSDTRGLLILYKRPQRHVAVANQQPPQQQLWRLPAEPSQHLLSPPPPRSSQLDYYEGSVGMRRLRGQQILVAPNPATAQASQSQQMHSQTQSPLPRLSLEPQQTLDPAALLVPVTGMIALEGAVNLLSHSSSPNLAQHDGAGIGEDNWSLTSEVLEINHRI
ncbi:hypothetical protein Acr_15g0003360 [Actinidia rufa]|uniref:Uncharacterized protein n=1 Tax=Actinidia rufa TaxID=165716 RepID=A0A7J0FTI0_9ERIC|nr:hypothetical protein Acr_15g0003360 [Actinidia rufa]